MVAFYQLFSIFGLVGGSKWLLPNAAYFLLIEYDLESPVSFWR